MILIIRQFIIGLVAYRIDMIFVHSFTAKPLLKAKFNTLNISLAITLVDYAYSVECIHKFGHTIELYADKIGADLLSCIPYDKVHIIEAPTKNYHFAASIKFSALQQMSLDQILVDGDIFLEKTPIYDIIKNSNKDMLVSLFEPRELIFKKENVINLFKNGNIPSEDKYPIEPFEDIKGWYNTSVIKFNNQSLKDEYIRQYLHHLSMAESQEFEGSSWPDIIYEQYNIEKLLENTGCSIDTINPFYGVNDDYCFKIGFCHMGSAKLESHNFYLRRLQIINFELFKIIQNQYIRWINQVIPQISKINFDYLV